MKNPASKQREKKLAVLAGVIILAAAIFSVVVKPQLQRHRLLRQNLQQQQLKLIKIKGDLRVKSRIDEMYARIEPLMAGAAADQQEISSFTRELHELYSPLRVAIKSVKILPLLEDAYYRKLLIKVEMSGRIGPVVEFISAAAATPQPIKIESLSLQATDVADTLVATFLISKIVAPRPTS